MSSARKGATDRAGRNLPEMLLIVDPIHQAGVDRLKESHTVILPGDASAMAASREVATVLVVRTSEITEAKMAEMPKLSLIVKHGSGVDNIDMAAATRRGIAVANSPGGANSTAVAEGAVALMLAVLRRVREMDGLVRDNRFDQRWTLQLRDLTGGALGLVGFGKIAQVVARICGQGFGMEVSAFDPFVSESDMRVAGARKVDKLLDLMANDVISVHAPLTSGTRHIIAAREIAAMKPTGILVNTSRGGLVDEPALADAIRAGRILGAGIDVFEAEPPAPDNPLFSLPNVVLSPHVAGVTDASMKSMALSVAEIVATVEAGRRPATLLNPEALGGRS